MPTIKSTKPLKVLSAPIGSCKGAPKSKLALSSLSGGSLADLIGNSISIKLDDGTMVIVPADVAGNRVANQVVAAEVRHIIQKSIKKYRDQDLMPTPKDLKDLASAAAELARFSGEIYREADGEIPTSNDSSSEPKKAQKK